MSLYLNLGKLSATLLCIVLTLIAPLAQARIPIQVGAYGFAPYFINKAGTPSGITMDAIKILNEIQKDYLFSVTEMPANRRYQFFKEDRIDMIFFEDPAWNWKSLAHFEIPLDIEDYEVYFALSKNAKSHGYFEKFKKKNLVGVLGYHYQFAGMNSDENYLKSHFKIQLVKSYDACVLFVLTGRADIGMATRTFMESYFRENPRKKSELVIGEKPDQRYSLSVILSKTSKLSKSHLETLIEKLRKHPSYQKSLSEFAIKSQD